MKYSGKKQGIKYVSELEARENTDLDFSEAEFNEILNDIQDEVLGTDDTEEATFNDPEEAAYDEYPDEEYTEEFFEDENSEDDDYGIALVDDDEEDDYVPSAGSRILKICGIGAVILQGIISVILVIALAVINLLPDFVIILIIGILAVLLGLTIFSQVKRFRTNKIRVAGMIVALILAGLLFIVSLYVFRTNSLLEKVTTTNPAKTRAYDIAVLADDPALTISDAAGYIFGTQSTFNSDVHKQIMLEAASMAGSDLTVKDFASPIEQAKALYEGTVQAIIFDNSFTSTIEEKYENFSSDIRVIAQIEIPEASTVEAVNVNVLKEPFIVFISGNDDFGRVNSTGRSDVNMLVVVEPTSKQVLLLTIPRDYYVQFPNVTGNARDKLTHAGIYGVDVLIASVEQLFGCKINYYVQVNFSSCEEIIDAIGGITLYNEYEFTDKWGDTFPEGEITLNGEYALDYVRERYSLPDGDLGRGRHQQAVIEAVINKLTSTASMTNFGALTNALENFAITNMPKDQITNIIKSQLGSGLSWDVLKVQALGESTFQPSFAASGEILAVVMPYNQSVSLITSLIGKMMSGQPLTEKDIEETWNFTDLSYHTPMIKVDDAVINALPEDHDFDQEINVNYAAPPVETTTAVNYTDSSTKATDNIDPVYVPDVTEPIYDDEPEPYETDFTDPEDPNTGNTDVVDPDPTEYTEITEPAPEPDPEPDPEPSVEPDPEPEPEPEPDPDPEPQPADEPADGGIADAEE